MMKQQHPLNQHFKAAQAQAGFLPFIYSKSERHAQQQAILKSLLAGLRCKSNA